MVSVPEDVVWRVASGVAWVDKNGHVTALLVDSPRTNETPKSLSASASAIWRAIGSGATVPDIRNVLASTYEANVEDSDIERFMLTLEQQQLVYRLE